MTNVTYTYIKYSNKNNLQQKNDKTQKNVAKNFLMSYKKYTTNLNKYYFMEDSHDEHANIPAGRGEDFSFPQSLLATLTGAIPSTISRLIAQNNYPHISRYGGKRKRFTFETTQKICYKLVTKGLIPEKKVQVFFNFKGGTGKTSICHQISIYFSLMGFRVLVLDCDPQAHLSYSLGFNESDDHKTLYDVIVNNNSIDSAIQNVYPNYDCIPSNLSLTRLELPLNQKANREKVLLKAIEPLKDQYDFIFIDTNPTISTVNRNVTLAADIVNIVCETQPYSLKGLEMLVEEIKTFSHAMEQPIHYRIIPNKYESKTATSQEAIGTLRRDYREYVMESVVRKCEDFNISVKKRKPLLAFCTKSSIALEDICDLGKEMLINSTKNIEKDEK